MKLQSKIMTVITPVLVSLAVSLGIMTFSYLSEDSHEYVLQEAKSIIDQSKYSLDQHINDSESVVQVISGNKMVKGILSGEEDVNDVRKYLDDLSSRMFQYHSFYKAFSLLLVDGTLDYHSGENINLSELNLAREALSKSSHTSIDYFGSDEKIYYIAKVFSDKNNSVIGYISLVEDMSFFSIIKSKKAGKFSDRLFLFNSSGIVGEGNKEIANFLLSEITGRKLVEKSEFAQIEGQEVGVYFLPINQGYYIANMYSLKGLKSKNQLIRSKLILSSFIVSMILALSTCIILRKLIINKIFSLKTIANKISEGNFSFDIEIDSKDEIGDLAISLSEMKNSLKRSRDENMRMAFYDELTGLPNRRSLNESLNLSILEADDYKTNLSVVMIDVDDFKYINDSHGHKVGDEILISISNRINSVLQKTVAREDESAVSYILSRIAGDEFTLIVSGYCNSEFVTTIMKELVGSFKKPIVVESQHFMASISVGASEYRSHARDKHDLLKFCDMAMYKSKEKGKGRYHWFDKTMEKESSERAIMITKIQNAIENNEFSLHYQPKVYCNEALNLTKEAEALIRWKTKEGEQIQPGIFIPFAERNGLINDIGKWVIEQLCKDIKGLEAHGYDDVKISFNASPNQFKDKNFRLFIESMIDKYQVSPKKLQMEITEHSLAEDMQGTRKTLSKLRELGIGISLDDFGAGYSSLKFLSDLPIDTIKIDRAFVDNCHNNKKRGAIIKTIITLANGLGMHSVAEGVESMKEAEFVKESGCTLIQGYYYYKPMPFDDLLKIY